MDDIDKEGYRANVGIILCNHDGAVLLGGRKGQDSWQFPQGGIQVGETVEIAMYRELQEEIGLGSADVDLLGSTNSWLRYDLPRKYIRRNVKPLCVGQKQRWFLLRLRGSDTKVRLDASDLPEFDRWRWVDYWSPVKEVIYFKRQVYVQALHELGSVLYPEGLPPRPGWWTPQWERDSQQ